MPRTDRFKERIGAVFLPEADTVLAEDDLTPGPEGPLPGPIPSPPGPEGPPLPWPPEGQWPPQLPPAWPPPFKVCRTRLKQGCYTLHFTPTGAKLWGTRFRGTLRVEHVGTGIRVSADLYSYRLLDDLLGGPVLPPVEVLRAASVADEAADTGGVIPVYRRRAYHSYLKGTGAQLFSIVSRRAPCTFALDFDEFVYNHPPTGFSGSFNTTPNRSVRYVFGPATPPDLHVGEAFAGGTKIGTVSIRWVSSFYRRADLRIHTLDGGAVAPPADVAGSTFRTIFADAGWDLTVTDGGEVPLPAAIAGQDIFGAWSEDALHTLMASVPGYDPAILDAAWRVYLVAVPARLGESRGIMFDSSFGADPNAVPREGSATFSHDGYPANESAHFDAVAGQQQFNVPRAFLRSATHEVGHAFNQIHQGFEGGSDNSIMTPTPSVANVLGVALNFPNDINLAFNDTVKRHLRHLPDPAVRPGAMDFFGSAIAAPEAAEVAWLDTAELSVELSTTTPLLGEPVRLDFTLHNAGAVPLPLPASFDTESLTVRINVSDPFGRITFMRPEHVRSCPRMTLEPLSPGTSVNGSATLFWGRDGFAFETPGRHVVEVIALWDIAGVPAGASAEREVYVMYPTSSSDNEVAAALLNPTVGAAVQAGNLAVLGAEERVNRTSAQARTHPAMQALAQLGLIQNPEKPKRKGRGKSGS